MVIYPGDWEEVKLSDIGYTYSGLTGKTKADFETGNRKFITFLNVLNNIKIDINILGRVNIREKERQNAVQVGDLFFNTSSETPEEVGMCAVLLDNLGICYLNSFCFGYRLKRKDISPLFLSYYFNSGVGRDFMRIHAQGSTRYNLSKQSFLRQSIHIPPLQEQIAIADTLATFDTHLENLTELITKKKAIRDGALDELMTGRTRLEGFGGDWEVKTLGESLKVKRGKRVVRRQLSTRGNFPVYQNSLAPLGFFERYNCEANSAFIIAAGNAGDVGFSESAFWAADDCYYFEECKNIDQKFLYYMLLHHQKYIYTQTRRTSIPRLSHDILEDILIPLPPLQEQIAIANTLTTLDKELSSLETERNKISQIRDGAINDLLSGKVRLIHGI